MAVCVSAMQSSHLRRTWLTFSPIKAAPERAPKDNSGAGDDRPQTPEPVPQRPTADRQESSHEYTASVRTASFIPPGDWTSWYSQSHFLQGLDDSPRQPFRGRHRPSSSKSKNSLKTDSGDDTASPSFADVAANRAHPDHPPHTDGASEEKLADSQTPANTEFPSIETAGQSAKTESESKPAASSEPSQAEETHEPSYADVVKHDVDISPTSSATTIVNGDTGRTHIAGSLSADLDLYDPDGVRERRGGKRKKQQQQRETQFNNGQSEQKQEKSTGVGKVGELQHADDDYDESRTDGRDEDERRAPGPGGIRFAPWKVPYKRRLQTLAVLWHSLSIGLCLAAFWFLCAMPIMWPLLLLYCIRLIFSTDGSNGSLRRRSERFRNAKIWRYFADYFPARLYKTADLIPTRKYIIGYHPHGIISHGAWVAFGTEALGFGKLFPGITNTLVTLESNFNTPFYRDYALAMGLQSVSKESITNLLTKGGRNGEGMGRAVTIVVGGARESLSAQPGTMKLILQSRKGFIKLAVRTGADLVPAIAFGENDLYNQLTAESHPRLHKLQMWILRVAKFTLPFLHGRGIFNYDVGLMPYRKPLNIVVGRPIEVVQSVGKDVSSAEVDRLHALYMDQLVQLWDKYKDDFAKDRKGEMEFAA
jgi:2-acylglycerol O-acyltransferase 2